MSDFDQGFLGRDSKDDDGAYYREQSGSLYLIGRVL